MAKAKLVKAENKEAIKTVAYMANAIWNEHYASVISKEQIDYMLDKFQSVQAISDAIEGQGYEYYLVEAEGKTVGYIGINRDYPAGKMYLSKLYLSKEARGKGYARDILDMLRNMALEDGTGSIWLTVNKDNPSVAIYEKLGFAKVNDAKTDIGQGFYMDDYIMEIMV